MTNPARSAYALLLAFGVLVVSAISAVAQTTMPQQLAIAGLRSQNNQGQFNAVAMDTKGNLFLLLDQQDGVRLLKMDAGATTVLAQAEIGAANDHGLAMALDPAGNVYVTGTSQSGSLTSTSGAAFPQPVNTTVNAFIAKFDPGLNLQFATFGGSGSTAPSAIAATADAVFITGLIYGSGLPVTPGGITQAPAEGSHQNGFVEKFSTDGTSLLYATYLSGAAGDTSPTVLAVDPQDDAYIAGFTTAPGFPTIAALVPRAVGTTSGFLTELSPAGDGITFSTYIPGSGITSIAIDAASSTLLLSGNVSLGQFPVASVSAPMVNTPYQVLLRMPLDGSSVLSSTAIAPGTQSSLSLGPNEVVWVDGTLTTPLLPVAPLSNIGTGYAARVSPSSAGSQTATVVDQTARFGGLPSNNPSYAGIDVNLTSIAVDPSGSAVIAGGMAPYSSSSLLGTQTFDLPLTNAPTTALPSVVRGIVLPSGSCLNSSKCEGSGAYLARITPVAAASLALSIDASPTILLRNLGSDQATSLQIAATGFTTTTTCGAALNAGAECTILLGGSGPGTLTVTAANATTQTASLAAIPQGTTPNTLVFSPKELDFGVQTSSSPIRTQTITVTNLGQQSQTFTSALPSLPGRAATTPYTFAESSSDCASVGQLTTKQLDAGATCHITLSFTASSDSTKDGPAQSHWTIGGGTVLLTGFSQALSLSLSANEIDFGTQFFNGLTSPRFLYLSNNSSSTVAHTTLALPASSPFTLTDGCPTQLDPHTVCQIQLTYLSPVSTSTDATTLTLDQGLSVQVTGQTIPQPGVSGSTAPPSLSVTPTTLSFANAVVVTGVSSSTQTVTIQNTGNTSFALALSLTGDFTDQTTCPATLAAGATCTAVLTFAPSQPGARQGLLGVTANGSSPVYVSLSGTGTPILPANNGTLDFGSDPITQPTVQWYKVAQSFSTLTAGTASPAFKVLLVEDTGTGHGQFPASAFLQSTTGSCQNCWVGVQFTAPAVGTQSSTLSLLSALTGNPYKLALTGNGLAPSGVVLSPLTQDFGPVAVNSTSAPQLFTLTNLATSGTAISVNQPAVTGDFLLSSAATAGTACAGTLAPNAACTVQVVFAPTATGQRTGTLTIQTGSGTATATLTGSGAPDPGVAFSPSALVFDNVPGASATEQTVNVTNTGSNPLQIGALSNASTAFQTSSACSSLAPSASCTLTVTYIPGSAIVTDTLQVPVTGTVGGAAITITYPVSLTGSYTAANVGLQVFPSGTTNFGPFAVNTVGGTRQFTVSNGTSKNLTINTVLPRAFVLSSAPCITLAAGATCNFSVTFVPVTAGDITGSLLLQGTPTDGSPAVNGIGYLEGYGSGVSALTVSGVNLNNGSLNFGQVTSGQSAQQVLTLTNTSDATVNPSIVTVHRVTSPWPFLSTTTCAATLAVGDSCTVTLTYTPLNQIAQGTATPPPTTDTGSLVVESDASTSPNTVNLSGTATPLSVGNPANTAPQFQFTALQNGLTFPTTAIGFTSAAQTVLLKNTGSNPLHVSSIIASPDFAVTSDCTTVLPSTTCTLTISFAPQVSSQSPGPRIGTAEIVSDSGTSLEFLSLVGNAGASALTFQPAALSFGAVLVGHTATLPLQITNSSSTAATFNAVTATGDYIVAGDCPAAGSTLAVGASCTLQVSFTPTTAGTRSGSLSVSSSASTSPLVALLTGTGTRSTLQINPAGLSFANTIVGSTASLPLTLTNTGTASITGIALAATGDFAVTAPCPSATLAAGTTCSATIAFTPTASGARTGTLTISSSDSGSPATLSLAGTGTTIIPPANNGSFTLSVNGAATAAQTVSQSHPATFTLTVTPLNGYTGQVVLSCAAITLAPSAACSIQPASVVLAGSSSQSATVTINTITSAENVPLAIRGGMDRITLCLLAPASFLFWRFRKTLPKQRISLLLALLCTSLALLFSGCGSNSNFRMTPTGSYQYAVNANSTNGTIVSQSVTLNLTIQ